MYSPKVPGQKSNRRTKQFPLSVWRMVLYVVTAFVISSFVVTAVNAARLYAPAITASKADAFLTGDGDGKADPGETIAYTVVINNSGTDATGVAYTDTIDANTTLVGGSMSVSPMAADDTYPQTVIGNMPIDSSLIPYSVASNDYLGLNPTAAITAYDSSSAHGGTVSMTTAGAGIGQFTYDPPAGYEGTDTFTYTLTDNANASSPAANRTATVTITISGMVWFINNNAGPCSAACDGRMSHPFTTLAAFNIANDGVGQHPAANDNIFIYESATNYSGAVTLLSGQKLIGQDASASLASITGLMPPSSSASFPAMNTGAPSVSLTSTVTLNNNVNLRGLQINAGTNTGLNDPAGSISGVTVSEISVSTMTGTAVSLSNTGGSFTFNSISSNGAANGIALSNTTGSFTVNGDGSNTTTGGNNSGGIIQNIIGANGAAAGNGIYLNNVQNVTLRRMRLSGNSNFAISGTNVDGFIFEYSTINGVNGDSAVDDEGSVAFSGLTGSASVKGVNISGGYEDNFRVRNISGTLNRIIFDSIVMGANDTSNGNAGILLDASNSAIFNVTVQNSLFTASRADLFHLNVVGNASSDLVFQSNNLSNNQVIATGGGGVTIGVGDNTGAANLKFNIYNNTFRDADGYGVLIYKSTDPGTLQGTFDNNTIGVSSIADSGSRAGSGLKVQSAGNGIVTVKIQNNHIYQYNNFGIELLTGGSATALGGNFNATVSGNTISNPGTGGLPMNGIQLNGGTVPGDTYAICADIGGAGALANVITGSGANGGTDFRLRQRQSTTVTLPGYSGGIADTTAVVTYVSSRNSLSNTGLASASGSGGGFVGGGGCAQPVAMAPSQMMVQAQPAGAASVETALPAPHVVIGWADFAAGKLEADAPAAQRSVLRPAVKAGGKPLFDMVKPDRLLSGETINVSIGTMPAGKSVTLKFQVTVNGPTLPVGTAKITNQGVVSGSNFSNVATINSGPVDCEIGGETCTPVDRPSSTVTSLTRQAVNPTHASSLSWQAVFADPISGLTASNFSLVSSGISGASITSVVPSTTSPNTTWTITVNSGTGDGTLGLNLVNDSGLSHVITNSPFTGEVYSVDKTAPSTTSFKRQTPLGSLTNSDTLVFRATFSEAVSGIDETDFAVNGTTTASVASVSAVSAGVYDITVSGGNLPNFDGQVGLNFGAGLNITDAAGNNLPNTEPPTDESYTVDNTPPAAPVIAAPANGSATNDITPTISGTAEANSTILVYINGVTEGSTSADGSGNWSYTLTSFLTNGALYDVKATATDAAGNTSAFSNTNSFTVDTSPPSAPVVVTPANGSLSNDSTPEASGTAEANSTVSVSIDGALNGTTSANASGNWSYTPATALADGSHTVKATASDAANNTSVFSNTNTFTLDATPPSAPTISLPTNGSIMTSSQPVIIGMAEANSMVKIYINGAQNGSTTANSSGSWTYTPAAALVDGAYTVKASASDAAGNTGVFSSTITITVDTTAPDAPIVIYPADGGFTNQTLPTITGTAEANSTVTVYVDGSKLGDTPADASGNWTISVSAALSEGPHTTKANAKDIVGHTGAFSAINTFTVDITPPAAPVVVTPTDGSVTSYYPVISGTAEAGSTVTVYFNGVMNGTTTANASGEWSYTPSTALADGANTVKANATDAAGNTGPDSSSHTFTAHKDNVPPEVMINQGAAQVDPTDTPLLHFTMVFSEPIDLTTMSNSDLTLGGTAPGVFTIRITQIAPYNGSAFDVAVSGMTGSGTVTVSMGANKVLDVDGNGNKASTSTDNSVLYRFGQTTLKLTATEQLLASGQRWKLTATVFSKDGTPQSGTVLFREGATYLGTSTLEDGVAVFYIASLPDGEHTITAEYQGGAFFKDSDTATVVIEMATKKFLVLPLIDQ
jgi:hypothetical protein